MNSSGTGNQHRGGKLGIGAELQRILDHLLGLSVFAGDAASQDKAAVGDTLVIAVKLLLRDEVNGGVVVGKVGGHGLDGFLDLGPIGMEGGDHVTLAGMLLTGGKVGIIAAANPLERLGDGDGVLLAVKNPLHAADGIGMSLAYALTPEGIIVTVGEDAVAEKPLEAEHAGIPAGRDQGDMAARAGAFVTVFEMLGNLAVIIKAIYDGKVLGEGRTLDGKIGGTAAAEDQHVDVVAVGQQVVDVIDRNGGTERFQRGRIAAGEKGDLLHVGILAERQLNAAAKIAVADDGDADGVIHGVLLSGDGLLWKYFSTRRQGWQEVGAK